MKARLLWSDGETVDTTVADFLADNETFDDDEVAAIAALQPGQSISGGGGAQPVWTLTVPCDAEAAS